MKVLLIAASMALIATNPCHADGWTYIVVDPKGNEQFLSHPPQDLSYPPKGEPMQVVEPDDHSPPHGTPLTSQQEQQRMAAKMLIIADVAVARSGRREVLVGNMFNPGPSQGRYAWPTADDPDR